MEEEMTRPTVIYLEPDCPKCGPKPGNREWSTEDIWVSCEWCGAGLPTWEYAKAHKDLGPGFTHHDKDDC